MTKDEDPKAPEHRSKSEDERKHSLRRREFVKLVGGTGVAATAQVLAGHKLASAATTIPEEVVPGTAGEVIGPGPVAMTLRINGEAKKLTVEPRVTLLDALRNHLDLTGAKKVCDRGTCGACTVIVNNQPVYSCSVLAIEVADRAGKSGADIRTIEGLAPEGKLHAVSASFVENDAQQCGFCTPGFIMSCKAYLDTHHNPTIEEVKHALGGNLCRCGTYMGVRNAVAQAAMSMKGGRA
ncbi:MAG TPA: (2Fe-2S)-binding protein [Candidatus Acidoferrum sp.]|nr:(2Fe-2S)-binding protein [Candidatus Acidoferrum sp.]